MRRRNLDPGDLLKQVIFLDRALRGTQEGNALGPIPALDGKKSLTDQIQGLIPGAFLEVLALSDQGRSESFRRVQKVVGEVTTYAKSRQIHRPFPVGRIDLHQLSVCRAED